MKLKKPVIFMKNEEVIEAINCSFLPHSDRYYGYTIDEEPINQAPTIFWVNKNNTITHQPNKYEAWSKKKNMLKKFKNQYFGKI